MSKKKITWASLIGIAFVLGSFLLAAGYRRGLRDSAPPQLSLPAGPVQNVRFALYDAGIYPREMRVRKGRIVVHLVDYTGSSSGLAVERDAVGLRARVGQVTRRNAHWRWQQELNLIPGTYFLSDLVRTQNQATLIVEP